jgi:hypothetical protein
MEKHSLPCGHFWANQGDDKTEGLRFMSSGMFFCVAGASSSWCFAGNMIISVVGNYSPSDASSHPERLQSSATPLRELQILHDWWCWRQPWNWKEQVLMSEHYKVRDDRYNSITAQWYAGNTRDSVNIPQNSLQRVWRSGRHLKRDIIGQVKETDIWFIHICL